VLERPEQESGRRVDRENEMVGFDMWGDTEYEIIKCRKVERNSESRFEDAWKRTSMSLWWM